MFKAIKFPHSALEPLRNRAGSAVLSARGIATAVYPCNTTRHWILVWRMKTRQEALDFARQSMPAVITKSGHVSYRYDINGNMVATPPILHVDDLLETFLAYFGTQDRPSRDWRDALRKDSDRRRELHDFMEHMVAHRHEIKARNLMGMRDYQKPFIDGLSNNINNLFGSFGSFGRLRAPRRGDLARLARAYEPNPVSMGKEWLAPSLFPQQNRGLYGGGFKRGEMAMVAGMTSGDNMRHMRAGLEAMRRHSSHAQDRLLLRVSFEDSNIDEKLRSFNEAALRDVVTDLPSLGYVAFGNGNLYSPKILADETWVTNGPFDPKKVPDIVGKMRFNAELPEHVEPVTPLIGRYYREAIDDTVPPSINLSFNDLNIRDMYPNLEEELEKKFGTLQPKLDDSNKE